MIVQNLEIIGFYLVIFSLLFSLLIKLRKEFWIRYVTVIFPLLIAAHSIYNLLSFPAAFQFTTWKMQRLPSNELIDLLDNSLSPPRASWIYPLVEVYYQGRTLFIPESLLDSLDLSVERLESQGRLADVIPIELDEVLTEGEIEMILGLEYVDLSTKEGNVYHFVTEEKDPDSPLLLLAHESQFFFIPEDLLTDLEVSL